MIRLFFAIVAALSFASPEVADAQTFTPVDSALTFHPTYVRASLDLFSETPTDTGSVTVLVLGTVVGGRFPIEGLPTSQSDMEVTFAITDLKYTSVALWDSWDGQYGGISYEFRNGWLRVYADDSPDATLADPSTFQDGELLLEGIMRSYVTGLMSCYRCDVFNDGWVEFTGGSLFSSVSRDGVGYQGWFSHNQNLATDSMRSMGFQYYGDGTLGLYIPVAIRPTTWGQIKARYP